MNKKDLTNVIAETVEITKKDAGDVLDAIVSSITKALSEGEKVQIAGFGTWTTTKREARTGRNPKTGESIQIAAKTVAKFKASKTLNETLN
jgi:DNA-binding protein HU-beta